MLEIQCNLKKIRDKFMNSLTNKINVDNLINYFIIL